MTEHADSGASGAVTPQWYSGISLPLLFFTCFFLVSASVGYWSVKTIAEYQDDVTTSLENVYKIDELYIEVLKGESGQRGYMITDLDSYLTPYTEAQSLINNRLESLKAAPLDAFQQQRAVELEQLIKDKLIQMEETVEAVRSNRERDAIQSVFTHRGRDLMKEISDLTLVMEDHERNILSTRVIQTRNSRSTALLAIVLANIVGLVMVFVTWSLIRSNMRKEKKHAEELTRANSTLEARVEERTDELQRYSTELKRSNRELQDFAFVASHDLQEPLRKIRAFGDRLQSQYSDNLGEKGADYINRMQNASERMSRLIDDLLAFSRITTRVKPFEPVDLNTVLGEVLEDLEIAIQDKQARIDADTLPIVEGDYSQLRQLLQNLIGNALKFTRPDLAPHINIKVDSSSDSQVLLSVKDNGIGFDNAFSERIFMPFQRLHGKHEFSGTGIGLAICRRIVERHGGTLTASSLSNQGACFNIALPLNYSPVDQELHIE